MLTLYMVSLHVECLMVPEFLLLFAKDDMVTVNIFLLPLILVWTNKDINIYNKQILSHVPRVTLHGSTRKAAVKPHINSISEVEAKENMQRLVRK